MGAISIAQGLHDAGFTMKIESEILDKFNQQLDFYLSQIDIPVNEYGRTTNLADFLKDTFYGKFHYRVAPAGEIDLAIHIGNLPTSPIGVLFELKTPENTAEMITINDLNKKGLQELLYYWLNERVGKKNYSIKNLVVTNGREFFIFDAREFERVFYSNRELLREYEEFKSDGGYSSKTDFFYKNIAKKAIDKAVNDISFIHFDISQHTESQRINGRKNLLKIFSPGFLAKRPQQADSNKLNSNFYSELLYIMGLCEVRNATGKKVISRYKAGERQQFSLIENTIRILDESDLLSYVPKVTDYGKTKEDQLFNVALSLNITWINRILFLKLLEAQLLNYHKGDQAYAFLKKSLLTNFGDVNSLFFSVLARRKNDRPEDVNQKYPLVPYLNSSLFETSDLEKRTMRINGLQEGEMPLFKRTALRSAKGKPLYEKASTLTYLLEFLDAYDFADDGSGDTKKTLINASVLGLIFEKINGYKDGAVFTPGYITMYMSREAIRQTVVNKFNTALGTTYQTFEELKDASFPDKAYANSIIDSITICDPAVGSGHFLVSVLNELIVIKYELGILLDNNGQRIKPDQYTFYIDNDELVIVDEDGKVFSYTPGQPERQRIQEMMFQQKRTIIENCLFGVDLNANSVNICRLRLWIELLKSAYYTKESSYQDLETLPNIDINIKVGNSLAHLFTLDMDLSKTLQLNRVSLKRYRDAVKAYKNAGTKDLKHEMESAIAEIKRTILASVSQNDSTHRQLLSVRQEISSTEYPILFEETGEEVKAKLSEKLEVLRKKETELVDIIQKRENYVRVNNAFEWRLEFPEILDDNGCFLGFDCIIGNPPYIKEYTSREAFDAFRDSPYYMGKMDIWYAFACFGLDLLKDSGYLCFIAQNNWTTSSGAQVLRTNVVNRTRICKLIDFNDYMVFGDSASIQTMIMLFQKDSTTDNYQFDHRVLDFNAPQESYLDLLARKENPSCKYLTPTIVRAQYQNRYLTFSRYEDLLDRLSIDKDSLVAADISQGIVFPQDFLNKKACEKLGGIHHAGDGVFGLKDSEYHAMSLNNDELSLIKPYFTSEQIFRYYTSPDYTLRLIYTDSSYSRIDSMDNCPTLKAHLDQFSSIITSSNAPYGLHRARKEAFFNGPKIVCQRKSPGMPLFSYSEFPCYVTQTYIVIKTEKWNMKFLTGVLNSKVIAFWLKSRGKMQGGNYQVDNEPILSIPLPPPGVDQSTIIRHVDEILSMLAEDPSANISRQQDQIDNAVFALYNLGPEDVAIINSSI